MRLNYKIFKIGLIFFTGFMAILSLLISFNSFAETTIEPKIIEYKGVKAKDLQKINQQVNALYQKQKQLEEKINQIEKLKNVSQTDKKLIEYFLTEIEELKKNQEELKNQITNFEKETKKSFFMLNLIQFITFGIFVVFMILLYNYKKDAYREIREVDEKVNKIQEKSDAEMILSFIEKAKTDPKAAEILQIYLKSRGGVNEV
ncbi:MAG: viral A-type inclusion protein [Sulfurihydrogenibium sp.]|jgi:DNA repair exonuclease SbcCD ATPase subunit|nr:viral A-type inclusion protein [Sulfurihydrogenibium sp.]